MDGLPSSAMNLKQENVKEERLAAVRVRGDDRHEYPCNGAATGTDAATYTVYRSSFTVCVVLVL
jgi:hypothetical protein